MSKAKTTTKEAPVTGATLLAEIHQNIVEFYGGQLVPRDRKNLANDLKTFSLMTANAAGATTRHQILDIIKRVIRTMRLAKGCEAWRALGDVALSICKMAERAGKKKGGLGRR